MAPPGKPAEGEYGEFFAGYVLKVDSENVIEFLANQLIQIRELLKDVPENRAIQTDPPYRWTLKQVTGHLIDGEKVFGYRLHRFACGDPTTLPGFEHEPYVENLDYNAVTLSNLLEEFSHLRRANVLFLERMDSQAWQRQGVASECDFTVRGQAYVLAGHAQHHLQILRRRIGFPE